MYLGGISKTVQKYPNEDPSQTYDIITVCFAKCDNEKCNNFTTNHDLSGSWCSSECWIIGACGEKIE